MKGRWFDIKEEIKEEINATGFQQKWILDPKGYFLIRVNTEKKVLEAGYCTNDHKLVCTIVGDTPESIAYKIIEKGFVSFLDHAAYLGKELQKAYLALKLGLAYQQDSELKID